MKPLYHPPVGEISVQGILHAFSDPIRLGMYQQLLAADCAKNCGKLSENCASPLAKSSASHHIRILREAGLVRSERRGVELVNTTRCKELKDRFGTLLTAILDAFDDEQKCRTGSKPAKN